MKPFVRITRHPYEEPNHLKLVVTAWNGRLFGQLEIYANAEDLQVLAAKLRRFPTADDEPVLWELGSENPEDRWAFYYHLRAYQVNSLGQCAVEFRFNNNRVPPHREVVEFSMLAYPSDLDRLADLLEQFGRFEHRVLEWTVTDGRLLEEA